MNLVLTLILDTKIDRALDNNANHDLISSLIKTKQEATDKVKQILEKQHKIDINKVKIYEHGDLVLIHESHRNRVYLKELT